jgi:hypothetical protein
VVLSLIALWLTRWQVLVIVDLVVVPGGNSWAQSLCERLPAIHAPATNARSIAVNSRRDVLLGWGWRPLSFLGFLRLILSIIRKKLWSFGRATVVQSLVFWARRIDLGGVAHAVQH